MVLLLLAMGSLSITSALHEHEFSSGYVCRKCFVTIEKYQALKCQSIDVETDLQRFPFFVLGVLKVTKAWYVSL